MGRQEKFCQKFKSQNFYYTSPGRYEYKKIHSISVKFSITICVKTFFLNKFCLLLLWNKVYIYF
jgi:hypothetical protein